MAAFTNLWSVLLTTLMVVAASISYTYLRRNNVMMTAEGPKELAAGLGKLNLGDLNLDEGKRLARLAVELIEDGTVGYVLVTARKG